jgi:hypothetical protein
LFRVSTVLTVSPLEAGTAPPPTETFPNCAKAWTLSRHIVVRRLWSNDNWETAMHKTLITTLAAAALAFPALAQQGGMQGDKAKTGSQAMPPAASAGGGAMTKPPIGAKLDRESVKQLQQALKQKGYDPGPVDGVIGMKTRSAVRDFQKAQGMQATGEPTPSTMSALAIPAGRMGSGATGSAPPKTGMGAGPAGKGG